MAGHDGGRKRRGPPQEMPALHGLADHAAGQPLRRRLAHVYLPGVGRRFPVERGADVRTRDQQLTVRSEREVEGEGTGVHTDGDPESHGTVVAPAYGLGNDPSHAVARPARMGGVVLSPEEDQEGVATEFDDVAAFGQADVDHVVEAGVEEIGELLGAAPAHEDSCSVSRVKPEMSAETSVPSTRRADSSGACASHSALSRGT